MTPKEDFDLVVSSIMETENLPKEAAIHGAQRYALDCARDLDQRATIEYREHRFKEGQTLSGLAKEYRNICFNS